MNILEKLAAINVPSHLTGAIRALKAGKKLGPTVQRMVKPLALQALEEKALKLGFTPETLAKLRGMSSSKTITGLPQAGALRQAGQRAALGKPTSPGLPEVYRNRIQAGRDAANTLKKYDIDLQ